MAALRWLRAQGIDAGHVVTSKFYSPVPVRAIRDGEAIHMVSEAAPNDAAFRYLKVPAEFFEAHLDDFATIGDDKINRFSPLGRPISSRINAARAGFSFAKWFCPCGCFRVTGEWESNTSSRGPFVIAGGVRSPRRARLR